jgi:hypothetical protein
VQQQPTNPASSQTAVNRPLEGETETTTHAQRKKREICKIQNKTPKKKKSSKTRVFTPEVRIYQTPENPPPKQLEGNSLAYNSLTKQSIHFKFTWPSDEWLDYNYRLFDQSIYTWFNLTIQSIDYKLLTVWLLNNKVINSVVTHYELLTIGCLNYKLFTITRLNWMFNWSIVSSLQIGRLTKILP